MTATLNLYQKIVQVRKAVNGLTKDKEGHGYDYVTGNQILRAVKEEMNNQNLLLVPSAFSGAWETYSYKTSAGKEKTDFVVQGPMKYTWVNGDNPEETLEVDWYYYGQQDDPSKAFGSALTYSERYFWLKMLGLPTDEDDPDGRDTGGRSQKGPQRNSGGPGQKPDKKITEPQVKRMFGKAEGDASLVRQVCKEHGYEQPADVRAKDYDEIVKQIIARTMAAGSDALAGGEKEEEAPRPIPVNQGQLNALFSLSKALNYTPEDMKDIMKSRYKKASGEPVESSRELTKDQAADFINHLEETDKEQAVGY